MKKIFSAILTFGIIITLLTSSFSDDHKIENNVLIIHSYYQHFAWTYGLQKGIEENLEKGDINYYLEYLDEHRLTSNRSNEDIFLMMKEKYKNTEFDCILVADNFAYNFVSEYYDELFEGVPIVLVGINNMNEEMLFNDNMTAIAQTSNHSKMIHMIEDLHPNMSELIVAGSNNQTSKNEADSYQEAVNTCLLADKTDFINVEFIEDLYDELSVYDDNAVVIITSLIIDKNKTMNLGPRYISNIIDNTGLPVYVAVDVMMGYEGDGAVGGYIVDGGVHGKLAANMVNRIMNGEKASDISVQWEPIVTPKFNYFRLQQFDINRDNLPEDSVILGEPLNGVTISYFILFTYVAIVSLLIILTVLLAYHIKIRRRVEKDLLMHQDALEKNNESLLTKNEEIDFLLNNDSITNFTNRNYFIELVDELLSKSSCLVMYAVHVKNIKQVDDTCGYQVGDAARFAVSNIIRSVFDREEIVFARYYDTFYIVDTAQTACEEIKFNIGNLEIELQNNIKVMEYDLEPKIKLGLVKGTQEDNGLELLKKADITILHAMLNENEVHAEYDRSFHNRLEEKINMERKIKNAIKEKEFELYYQPQIDSESEKVISCEALIRWKNTEDMFISPVIFIPIAEEMGLIQEIGDWVIFEACQKLEKWEQLGIKCPMSINVSAKQINSHLIDTFKGALSLFEVTPKNIYLEITETAVMDDTQNNIKILKEISELGIGIALDDFGIGHSSLKYIMDFPISKLKIDKSFIDDIVDPEQLAIVKAMYELGKVFNYEIIAEGVETHTQSEIVKSIGIEVIQGYYYSRALAEDDFKKFYYKNCPPEFGKTLT